MAIETITTKLQIGDVTDVQITETVDDGVGGYLRSIKVIAETAPGQSAQVFELLIGGETEEVLEITTPALQF